MVPLLNSLSWLTYRRFRIWAAKPRLSKLLLLAMPRIGIWTEF
nr:MAG TPA: hypothetical protein [Caudoviricetes sp.]